MTRHLRVLLLLATGAALAAPGRTQDPAAGQVDVRAAARRIDALVLESLATRGEQPNRIVDDATFARRAWLTIVGRAPTLDEVQAFLKSGDGRDRLALVDSLLESPGRTSHEFNLWADVFRVQTRMMRRISGEPFIHFLKDAIARNVPYDDMVRQMLVAEGAAHARDNGATGYFLRDLGMPLDNMSNTMRVFVGTRMECAQCHNHPFERWTQKEFFELAAFTDGMRYTTIDPRSPQQRELAVAIRDLREDLGDAGRRALQRVVQDTAVGIAGTGTGGTKLPKDYKYDDARPSAPVAAHVPFGTQPDVAEPKAVRGRTAPRARPGGAQRGEPSAFVDNGSRAAFADWVVDAANPRFTTVIVNRVWKRVFGAGLIDPVDDLRDDTVASIPALETYLEDLMRAVDYDLKAFERILLHTSLFAREADTWQPESGEPFRFRGPLLRRLTAEQVYDSLLGLAIGDPDATLRDPAARAEPVYARYESVATLDAAGIRALAEREALRVTDPQAYRRQIAAEQMAARADQQRASTETRDKVRKLLAELRIAQRKKDQQRVAAIEAELAQLREAATNAARRRGDLVRASELPQPAPAGHFVREWGQSERDQIESSNTDASVPQALQLLNGIVDGQLLRRDSTLLRAIESADSVERKIDTAFLAILGRAPTTNERSTWRRDVARDAEGIGDLVWTLVNSHEFRFVQ